MARFHSYWSSCCNGLGITDLSVNHEHELFQRELKHLCELFGRCPCPPSPLAYALYRAKTSTKRKVEPAWLDNSKFTKGGTSPSARVARIFFVDVYILRLACLIWGHLFGMALLSASSPRTESINGAGGLRACSPPLLDFQIFGGHAASAAIPRRYPRSPLQLGFHNFETLPWALEFNLFSCNSRTIWTPLSLKLTRV